MTSRCASCGVPLWGAEVDICSHHGRFEGDWAAGNRIANDFFMRGVVHPELAERGDDLLIRAMRGV